MAWEFLDCCSHSVRPNYVPEPVFQLSLSDWCRCGVGSGSLGCRVERGANRDRVGVYSVVWIRLDRIHRIPLQRDQRADYHRQLDWCGIDAWFETYRGGCADKLSFGTLLVCGDCDSWTLVLSGISLVTESGGMVARQTGSPVNTALPSDFGHCADAVKVAVALPEILPAAASLWTASRRPQSGHVLLRRHWFKCVCAMLLVMTSGCQTGTPFWRSKAEDTAVEKKDSRFSLPKFARKSDREKVDSDSPTEAEQEESRVVGELIQRGETALRAAAAENPVSERQLNEARRAYREVLAIEPGQATAHHGLAMIGDLTENWSDAEYHYKQALKARPGDVTLLSDLGYSYVLQSRYSEAAGYLNQALEIDPGHEGAHVNLALLDIRQGNRSAAEQRIYQRHGRTPYADELLAGLDQQAFPEATRATAQRDSKRAPVAAPPATPESGMTFEQIQELARLERERSEQQRLQKYGAGQDVSQPVAWDKAGRFEGAAGPPARSTAFDNVATYPSGNLAASDSSGYSDSTSGMRTPPGWNAGGATAAAPTGAFAEGSVRELNGSGTDSTVAVYGGAFGSNPRQATSSMPSQELRTAPWPAATAQSRAPSASRQTDSRGQRQNPAGWPDAASPGAVMTRSAKNFGNSGAEQGGVPSMGNAWGSESAAVVAQGVPLERPVPIYSGNSGLPRGSLSYGQPAGFVQAPQDYSAGGNPPARSANQPVMTDNQRGADSLRLEGLNAGPGNLFPIAQTDPVSESRRTMAGSRNAVPMPGRPGFRQGSVAQPILPTGFSVSDVNGTRTGPKATRIQSQPLVQGQQFDQQQDAYSMEAAVSDGMDGAFVEEPFDAHAEAAGQWPGMNSAPSNAGQTSPSALQSYERQLQLLNNQFNTTVESMEQP